MTTTVSFHFTSPQFAIQSAAVKFMKGARLFSDGDFRIGRITEGSIDGVLVEGPIEFDAMLSELTVTRRNDSRRYDVPFFPVSGAIRPQEISDCLVTVELDIPVVVVMRVEDAAGTTVPGAKVSFSIPSTSATFEGTGEQARRTGGAGHAGTLFVPPAVCGRPLARARGSACGTECDAERPWRAPRHPPRSELNVI